MPLCPFINISLQWENEHEPGGANRQHSNGGYQKLEIEDHIFLFLTCMHRRMPFETISWLFGIGYGTAVNYYGEMLKLFFDHLVPCLLFPLSAAQTKGVTPEEFAKALSNILVIWDATGFKLKSKENVLLSCIPPHIRRACCFW
jgi:hypothetical protein